MQSDGVISKRKHAPNHMPFPTPCRQQDYASVQAAGGMPAYRQRRASKQAPVHYKVVAGGKLVWAGTGIHGGAFGEGS